MYLYNCFRTDNCKLETEGQNTFWCTCQQEINSAVDLEVNLYTKIE